jgi:hypothetical protein
LIDVGVAAAGLEFPTVDGPPSAEDITDCREHPGLTRAEHAAWQRIVADLRARPPSGAPEIGR